MSDKPTRLREAAEVMKTSGWCKGQLKDDQGGYCAQGAYLRASGILENDKGFSLFDRCLRPGYQEEVEDIMHDRAMSMVGMPLYIYNNLPETTLEDITSLMLLMADMIEAEEQGLVKTESKDKELTSA